MKVTMTVTIDGKVYTGEMVEKQEKPREEPRIGQICEFWDGDNKANGHVSLLCSVAITPPRYMDQNYRWWEHAEVCRDPLTLGRTLAPEGAEWIAPWSQDMWAFFEVRPEASLGGFYLGVNSTNSEELAHIFPAPTDGCEPIKLWDEEDGTDTKIVGAPPIVRR